MRPTWADMRCRFLLTSRVGRVSKLLTSHVGHLYRPIYGHVGPCRAPYFDGSVAIGNSIDFTVNNGLLMIILYSTDVRRSTNEAIVTH